MEMLLMVEARQTAYGKIFVLFFSCAANLRTLLFFEMKSHCGFG